MQRIVRFLRPSALVIALLALAVPTAAQAEMPSPVLVGIPASMVVVGKLLSRLNRTYGAVTGAPPRARTQPAWMKSLRGERDGGHQRTVLDVVMVWSVALALVCFAIWFFAFAGSSLPS